MGSLGDRASAVWSKYESRMHMQGPFQQRIAGSYFGNGGTYVGSVLIALPRSVNLVSSVKVASGGRAVSALLSKLAIVSAESREKPAGNEVSLLCVASNMLIRAPG